MSFNGTRPLYVRYRRTGVSLGVTVSAQDLVLPVQPCANCLEQTCKPAPQAGPGTGRARPRQLDSGLVIKGSICTCGDCHTAAASDVAHSSHLPALSIHTASPGRLPPAEHALVLAAAAHIDSTISGRTPCKTHLPSALNFHILMVTWLTSPAP